MRRRLIPVNVLIAALLFALLSLDMDQTKLPPAVMKTGRALYEQECQRCHQPGGEGVMGANPPLTETEWVLGPKKRLIETVVSSPDAAGGFDGNPMPLHPRLTNQEVADVLTYVRNSFGNKASAVTAREVKRVRLGKMV